MDGVFGFDHYGAERRTVRIVDSLVIHGDSEIAGGAISFHPRVRFFESAPHGLLSLVDAEEHLRRRSSVLVK